MPLTLSSLPLLALVSSQAVWNTGDGNKWRDNETITSAIVADGVVDLSTGEEDDVGNESGAFQFCTKLKTVRLPESLRKIGDRAFLHCEALVHVDIPSGANEVGGYAFFECSSLETVTIPEGVVNLPEGIFYKCKSFKSVKLPSSLKTIGKYAFQSCSALTTINDDALDGVTEIGSFAFTYCNSLTTFKLPPLLTTIETFTLSGCESLSKVELPPSLESIKKFAFGFCCEDLCITIPETMECIEVYRDAEDDVGKLGCNTMGYRVQLPTSLEFLHNGWDLEGLLHDVRDVVISCKVDVQLLVNFIDLFEENDVNGRPFFNPNLKFRVLHCNTPGAALPPIESHVPFSTFHYDMTLRELKRFAKQGKDLSAVVEKAYLKKRKAVLEKLKNLK